MKKNLSLVSLAPTETIADALVALERNKPSQTGIPAGIALMVDARNVLVGIVTDSDLRHALTEGAEPSRPLSSVMNRNAFTVQGPVPASEILAAVSEETRARGWDAHHLDKIIIVDERRRPIDIIHRADLEHVSDARVKRIGVVGLGFVGLTLALTLADIGFFVTGYDINPAVSRMLRRKIAPFFEKGMDDMLTEHGGTHFVVANDFAGDRGCDVYFIAVGTPIGPRGKVNRAHLISAAKFIGRYLKRGDTVILRSTVPIGATRGDVVPVLERVSGLVAGNDFLVAFAPERTAAGKALEELRSLPQVIGGLNRASENAAVQIFSAMTDMVHVVDSLEEAETVKLVNNTHRDVSFAFANEVSLICRKWGLDTNNIVHAANAGYIRGGVPRPSPGVGGYCLSKDPFIFIESAKVKGYTPRLFTHARRVHNIVLSTLANDIDKFLKRRKSKSPKIFIMGFGFKGNPPTSDMRESSTVDLVKLLRAKGYKNIHGYDPVIGAREVRALGVHVQKRIAGGFDKADAVIVMTDHASFRDIDIRQLVKKSSAGMLLFDTWALYSKEKIQKISRIEYWSL